LMYFNAEAQGRILRRFHFALQPTGLLFLGKSEMLLTRGELFRPLNLKRRIFTKVVPAPAPGREVEPQTGATAGQLEPETAATAFDATPVAQLVVDRARTLVLANEAARVLLGIAPEDVGRPLKDLRVSYRPAELRASLDTVFADGHPVSARADAVDAGSGEPVLEVRLTPLRERDEVTAAAVTFLDVTAVRGLEEELERSKAELSAAYEELQSTIEELETTNEELQSTNEELETTNEELQSTNEELETMNEELQSANEELETTNEQLRARGLELDQANAFMETVLTSMGVGVVVVDADERVRVWNAQSEDLWGLRTDEVIGQHVLALDIGLPLDDVGLHLREALTDGDGSGDVVVDAVDRRGRAFACQVTVVPLRRGVANGAAAIILAKRHAAAGG
jgi:two-component system, chemotaxis family, CheB/CheR fusion protein